ncbi:MAG: phosphocholine cytidylyltransferase family protein [Lutibacter sp.]|nr:phosphocholine cytidylyltransferase family protein [Lutibacter sp.]
MKALILVAGMGTRLGQYTTNIPKSLLEIKGKPILGHIIDRIIINNINEFVIVVGFQKEKIINYLKNNYPEINFTFVENNIYEKTNTLYSMWLAKDYISDEFLYLHGDLLFHKNILRDLLDSKHQNGAIVEPHKESMGVYGFDNIITRFSKKKDSMGKALGIYKFSKVATENVFAEAERIINKGEITLFQSEAINPTILNHRMNLVSTNGMSWIEVDEPEDLREAEKILDKIEREESS